MDSDGDKHRNIEAHYRKLLNLDPKTKGCTQLKHFFHNMELHIRGLEAQTKQEERRIWKSQFHF